MIRVPSRGLNNGRNRLDLETTGRGIMYKTTRRRYKKCFLLAGFQLYVVEALKTINRG